MYVAHAHRRNMQYLIGVACSVLMEHKASKLLCYCKQKAKEVQIYKQESVSFSIIWIQAHPLLSLGPLESVHRAL